MATAEKRFHNKWRPSIGWLYIVVVSFDFVLAPTGFAILQAVQGAENIVQWAPISLAGSGILHMSMLTILGVYTYGRTKEKLKGVAENITIPELIKDT